MVALLAEISVDPSQADARGTSRRKLRLVTEVSYSHDNARVLILNLSKSGMLIETAAPLTVGESFEVDLPEAGTVIARVIRRQAQQFGCAFDSQLSQGALSGALLQSEPDRIVPPAVPGSAAVQSEWDGLQAPAGQTGLMMAMTVLGIAVMLFMAAFLGMSVSAD